MADTAMTVAMPLVRALHLAAALSLLGILGFMAWVLPKAMPPADRFRRRMVQLWWLSGMVALLAGLVWFGLQVVAMADAGTVLEWLRAVPLVALQTHYGTMLMLRTGLLLVVTLLGVFATRSGGSDRSTALSRPALMLTVITLGLQGFIGHAGAVPGGAGDSLVAFEAMHLVAAGLWLGGLLPLWLSIRMLSPSQAAALCERFSPLGLACVLVLAGTGLVQGLELIGSLAGLFHTTYGRIALLKIGLFPLALGLAAANRLWLTDRLAARVGRSHSQLSMSIGFETMIGLAIVTAAAFLASSNPGAHHARSWPFSWPASLLTGNPAADPQVGFGLIAIAITTAFVAGLVLVNRFRRAAKAMLATPSHGRLPSPPPVTACPTRVPTSPAERGTQSTAGGAASVQNAFARHAPDHAGGAPGAATVGITPLDTASPPQSGATDR